MGVKSKFGVSRLFIILLTGSTGQECIDNDDVKMR